MKETIDQIQLPIRALKDEYRRKCDELVMAAIAKSEGNLTKAARALGVGRTSLTLWLRVHHPEVRGTSPPINPRRGLAKIKELEEEICLKSTVVPPASTR